MPAAGAEQLDALPHQALVYGANVREAGRAELLFVLWLAEERQIFAQPFCRGFVEVVGVGTGHEDRVDGGEVEVRERYQGVAAG